MKPVVDYLLEKGLKEFNEDSILIGDNIFGVFDGASSLNKINYDAGKTGGLLASQIVKDIFEKNDQDLLSLFKKANDSLRLEMKKRGVDLNNEVDLWTTTVAVVKINDDAFDWIQISDSLILVIFEDNTYQVLVDNYDHDRENLILWKELAQQKQLNIRLKLADKIKETRERANIDYGSLNGVVNVVNFLKKGTQSLKNVKHILLFSDGLIPPKENPEENDDFDKFVKIFLNEGLLAVDKYVFDLEESDLNCWKYPRLSAHDDRAIISLSF